MSEAPTQEGLRCQGFKKYTDSDRDGLTPPSNYGGGTIWSLPHRTRTTDVKFPVKMSWSSIEGITKVREWVHRRSDDTVTGS